MSVVWDPAARFPIKDLAAADLPEISLAELPTDLTGLTLTAHAFQAAYALEKSTGELKKQFITTGSVQLNGGKLTDPNATIAPAEGDVMKLSKKHAVRHI